MKVFVSTYAKYNGGSIAGGWLNLDDYANKDEFLQACRRLHRDERDPEYMYQDFAATEDWERHYYDESNIDGSYWPVAAEERAKAAKEAAKPENALRSEYLAVIAAELGADRVKYHDKHTDVVVKLSGGRFLAIEKPDIYTRHCEGEDDGRGRSMSDALAGCAWFKTEAGFKAVNRDENKHILTIDWMFDTKEHAANVRICTKPGSKIADLVDLKRHYITGGAVLEPLSDEDKARIERGYAVAAANFDKRLTDYWKRWGASKLQTWTYWTEA